MTHGAGHATTTVAGLMTPTMAGYGYPVTNGLRHGYHGASAAVTQVGRRLAREQALLTTARKAGGYSSSLTTCTRITVYTTGEAPDITTPTFTGPRS